MTEVSVTVCGTKSFGVMFAFFPPPVCIMRCRFYSEYLKPIAEEERKVEEAEKKVREEQERIAKELAEG